MSHFFYQHICISNRVLRRRFYQNDKDLRTLDMTQETDSQTLTLVAVFDQTGMSATTGIMSPWHLYYPQMRLFV